MSNQVHGTGENRRNFLYVTDVANAFDCILHKGLSGSIYNIGGTSEMTNLKVAETLIRTMKGTSRRYGCGVGRWCHGLTVF